MQRRPTVDPHLLFRFSYSCSFTASDMTNVCCRKFASMVSTSESCESFESVSKNFSHGLKSIYMHTGASINYTARKNHKIRTNWWWMRRMIPGGDEGRARRWSIPGGGSDEGAALLARYGGRCSVTAREGGGRPRGAILPQIWPESLAASGRKQGQSAAEGGWGKCARAEMSLPPTASV